jgi:hypothetical protein
VRFGESGGSGRLYVWYLSSDGTPERVAFVNGCNNSLGFELSEVTVLMLRMRVEYDLVAELTESERMECCRVANRKDRVLVATVNKVTSVITVVDALTFEIVYKSCATEDNWICSVAAVQREEDGRILVVTGGGDGMMRMRMADSGALIGQWQAMREKVDDVAIAVKAGNVMGVYGECGGLWIWSFGAEDWRGDSNSRAIADGMLLPSPATAEFEARRKNNN